MFFPKRVTDDATSASDAMLLAENMNTEARVDKLIWIKKVHMRDLKVSQ
jgi:hypothetical protein